MENIVAKLKEIVDKHPLKEKIVLVDSHRIGLQINEAFIKKGYSAINLKFLTVNDLATELVMLHGLSMKRLKSAVGQQLIYSILYKLKTDKQLTYFHELEVTPSFSRSVYHTIQLMRLAGFTKEDFPEHAFITKEKADDFLTIMEAYEQVLVSQQLVDEAALLQKAKEVATKKDAIFILQSNLHLSFLEEEFLQAIMPVEFEKLPLTPIYGIHLPERSPLQSIAFGEPRPLSFLYDLEHLSDTPNIHCFIEKTEEIEIKHVLDRIKRSNKSFDEQVIYYTSTEPYVTTIYHLSEKLNIPTTFAEGISITQSKPGQLVAGIVDWIRSNYSASVFIHLLQEGLIELGEGSPSNSKITKIVRELQVGWDKGRYIRLLKNKLVQLNEKIDEAQDQTKKEYYERKQEDYQRLLSWFEKLFSHLPNYASTMNVGEVLKGIRILVEKYSKTTNAIDHTAKKVLLEEIEMILPYANETLSLYDVFEKVYELLSLRILQSPPKPGHLHVASYKSGVYNNRPKVFIVGLDHKKFPGAGGEDPLLLDQERIAMERNIPLKKNVGKENVYTMLQVMAGTSGQVVVSFCNYDVVDNRELSPSHLFLQCYRASTGNLQADYQELKKLSSSYISTEIFEEKDFWNEKLLEETNCLDEEVLKLYENIKLGLESERKRLEEVLTNFDGQIEIDIDQFDPRRNKEIVLSSSQLELLAKCPFSYFLQYILNVHPVEETEFTPNRWLDAATRGSLLHKIFETFYKELKEKEEKPSFKEHKNLIESIAINLIDKQKEMVPPPNERVFERESRDILECSRIFLKEEESHTETYEPFEFEYSFGLNGNPPAEISLPSGEKMLVKGIIDRVDRAGSGSHYHIIDYKTGSTYGYDTNIIFKGGRQLQHYIYALAIEAHLQLQEGTVQESAYYFPTVRGLAERIVHKQDETVRTNGGVVLENLINIIGHGTFTMTDNADDCTFCEFKQVCRRHYYTQELLEGKQMDPKNAGLRYFKGVRAYD